MTDRPIIFSAPMIRALIDGRKTQTRRIIKPQPEMRGTDDCTVRYGRLRHSGPPHYLIREILPRYGCPFGKPGDRLWVRETFGIVDNREFGGERYPEYRADLPSSSTEYPGQWPADEARGNPDAPKWRPSTHMPRWASRLTLVVTDVRAQRLQDISEGDARAEGFPMTWDGECYDPPSPEVDSWQGYGRAGFCLQWNLDNGPGAWDANPWVWALTFDVQRRNIDAPSEAAA